MNPISVLFYGGPGAGKTALAVSSFWDYIKLEPIAGRTGRLILIGREENDALGVPEEMVKRFPMPSNDPIQFSVEFNKYLRALARAAKTDDHPTDLVIDGFTELCYDYTYAYRESFSPGDQFETYREWQREFISIMQLLHPKVLGANIFGTARVAEWKKSTKSSRGSDVKGDPAWMQDFKYFPAMEGWARHNMGHYFNIVSYLEPDSKTTVIGSKRVSRPVFRSHWLGGGEFWVKNIYTHLWEKGALETQMESVMWPEIEAKLETIMEKKEA